MKVSHLKKEHSLNKILRKQKINNSNIKVLFVSLWDSFSTALLEKANSLSDDDDDDYTLFVVDSFNMPHSFVIFNTTKLPHLVSIHGRRIQSEDYLPMIYKKLGIK